MHDDGIFLSRLALKVGIRTDIIDIEDINYFLSSDDFTFIYVKGNEYISDISLTHFEKQLNPSCFFRCHRKAIIPISQIISLKESTEMVVILKGGQEEPLARRRKAELLRRCSHLCT